ncbi:MAG TPA: FRG domain-containing protein [Blastocatellia bacterium]|nr:FRG domain-containing protein [Blastocatellia bacterium]
MEDIIISSWNELNERLYEGSWNESLKRFRANVAYRGQSDYCADLTTSLMRLGGPYEKQEGHLLRNFRKYALRDAVSWVDSVWDWLAVAQHHGLPTRLLDWTYSPYVAMHFATENVDRFHADGVIWRVDFTQTNKLLPDVLKRVLAEEGSDVFTVEMLNRVSKTLQEFDSLSEEDFVIFLEPPSLDDRIVNQFALFSLMSRSSARFDEWLKAHDSVFQRIVIPTSLKWEVRDKLDQANITERVLFPGLDGLSRWLKRYYSPKNGNSCEEDDLDDRWKQN